MGTFSDMPLNKFYLTVCRPVYTSKAGNLARLLGKASSPAVLEELPRIASGSQKEVAEDRVTEAYPTRNSVAGLQGIGLK